MLVVVVYCHNNKSACVYIQTETYTYNYVCTRTIIYINVPFLSELMLTYKQSFKLFKTHIDSEFSGENLDFWMQVKDYELLHNKTESEVLTRANIIYDRFCAPGSNFEVCSCNTINCKTHIEILV